MQLGSLSQEYAEIPDRPGILGDQGVIQTGVERNDIARPSPPFEGIGKWESTPASLHGDEYRYHPIRMVTPRVEAGIDDPAGWCRWKADSIDGFPPPHIRPQISFLFRSTEELRRFRPRTGFRPPQGQNYDSAEMQFIAGVNKDIAKFRPRTNWRCGVPDFGQDDTRGTGTGGKRVEL